MISLAVSHDKEVRAQFFHLTYLKRPAPSHRLLKSQNRLAGVAVNAACAGPLCLQTLIGILKVSWWVSTAI
jgi:hypothetical protein